MPTDAPGRRGLASLLLAEASALTANRMLLIAVPWFVLVSTRSVVDTGLVAFFQVLPFVIAQPLVGPLIDRLGPRRVSVVGDLAAALAVAAIPLLYALDALPVPALMALVAVFGAADGPATAAKAVFIPSVTTAAAQSLERGTGLKTAVERAASIVGPALAGVLVAWWGGPTVLWLSAALLAVSAAVVAALLTDPVVEAPPEGAGEGYFAQLREGLVFLRHERLLRAVTGVLVTTNLLDQAFISVLLPVWTQASGRGADTVGLAVSVMGVASLLSTLAAAAVGERLPRRQVFLIGFLVGGLPRFAVLALGLPLWAVLVGLAVGGFGFGFVNPVLGAVSYERIPPELLGRVQTLGGALSWAGIPFGGLVGAALVSLAGVTGGLWVAGAAYLVAVLVPGLRPEWAQMRSGAGTGGGAPTSDGPDGAVPDPAVRDPAASQTEQ